MSLERVDGRSDRFVGRGLALAAAGFATTLAWWSAGQAVEGGRLALPHGALGAYGVGFLVASVLTALVARGHGAVEAVPVPGPERERPAAGQILLRAAVRGLAAGAVLFLVSVAWENVGLRGNLGFALLYLGQAALGALVLIPLSALDLGLESDAHGLRAFAAGFVVALAGLALTRIEAAYLEGILWHRSLAAANEGAAALASSMALWIGEHVSRAFALGTFLGLARRTRDPVRQALWLVPFTALFDLGLRASAVWVWHGRIGQNAAAPLLDAAFLPLAFALGERVAIRVLGAPSGEDGDPESSSRPRA